MRALVIVLALFPIALALDNGLGLTPQMGWNSWNKFACSINEDLIKSTADALISTDLAKVGYTYLNLDDCWEAPARDSNGRLWGHPETFPSGMKSLGDFIHERGLKYGIYSDAGYQTCAVHFSWCNSGREIQVRWVTKRLMPLHLLSGALIT
jgi:hypothetical protein